jgi:subtilisin family serine protease
MKAFEKSVDACRKEPDEESPRVRIAILDTGVDLSHLDMTAIYNDGRLQYQDFVDNSSSIKDLDGHGTHCTSILANLAPNAEIFVARVFRKSWADSSSVAIVTKVIQTSDYIELSNFCLYRLFNMQSRSGMSTLSLCH